MDDDQALDLRDLVAELAADLEDVSVSGDGGVFVYGRGGTNFARAAADSLELRLPEDIAEAALNTPDTVAVPGQAGWVRLEPVGVAGHAIDRATAWLQTAWRHAEGR